MICGRPGDCHQRAVFGSLQVKETDLAFHAAVKEPPRCPVRSKSVGSFHAHVRGLPVILNQFRLGLKARRRHLVPGAERLIPGVDTKPVIACRGEEGAGGEFHIGTLQFNWMRTPQICSALAASRAVLSNIYRLPTSPLLF